MIAMESEAAPLIEKMQNVTRREACGREIVCGALGDAETAAVICGVGKVNAAAGTQYAIDCLGAEKIINVGVAGGLNPGTEVGKIYGIEEAAQYDFDLAALNGTPKGTLDEYETPYLPLSFTPLYPLKKLCTGDRFNDDPADYEFLTKELKADIRDMELGAVAHVCRRANIPCYAFKVISDVAGSGATTEQFSENLGLCKKTLGDNIEVIFKAVN